MNIFYIEQKPARLSTSSIFEEFIPKFYYMKKILLGVAVLALPIISFANSSNDWRESPRYCSNTGSTISTGAITGKDDDCDGIRSGTFSGSMNTGALIEANLKALHADISKLTLAQKVELTALIRTYLTSQGITPTIPTMNDDAKKMTQDALKAKRDALKVERKARFEALKEKRKQIQASIKEKREQMKETREYDRN